MTPEDVQLSTPAPPSDVFVCYTARGRVLTPESPNPTQSRPIEIGRRTLISAVESSFLHPIQCRQALCDTLSAQKVKTCIKKHAKGKKGSKQKRLQPSRIELLPHPWQGCMIPFHHSCLDEAKRHVGGKFVLIYIPGFL